MTIPTLDGIRAKTISTSRLSTRVLFSGDENGEPVLFLHGNASTATWWEPVMLTLPPDFYAIAPDQRGYGAADPEKKVDATRGMGDFADDAAALLDFLDLEQVHVIGISMGGSIVWRMLMDYPERFLSVTVVNPGSPYGFGSSKGDDGIPCYDDFAGSGGGLVPADAIKYLTDPNLIYTTDSPLSPRNRIKGLYANPSVHNPHEDVWIDALLATHYGDQAYPGDSVPSPNWPFMAPGVWGATNGLSRKYNGDVDRLYTASLKHTLLWIRGAADGIVSDRSLRDVGTLGEIGLIPGWPGADVFPPQPMVSQTRAVLDQYAQAGGGYKEIVLEDAGHVPYVEKPDEFDSAFHAHLRGNRR